MKYCFIVQYYGEFPIWFPLFLKSCEHNKGIDWLFFVDHEYTEHKPHNVKFHLQSPTEFQKLCKKKFGHEVELMCYKGRKGKTLGYFKLCDYRPMYGFLFEDYLKDYDYWGWCDIDMIFGNLIDYVKKQSGEFECMSFAAEPYPLPYGPCTLIKNNIKMNMLFQKSKDIDNLLTTQRHFHFDEDWTDNVHSIGHVMREENIRCLRESVGNDDGKNTGRGKRFGVKKNWRLNWDSGKLYWRKQEIMFFHFGQTKQLVNQEFDFSNVKEHNNIWFSWRELEFK